MDGKKVKRGDRDIEKDTEKKEEQKLMGRGIRKNRIFGERFWRWDWRLPGRERWPQC